jgi:SPP1 gp7 family putative phage head morphogenesis protein
VGPNDKVLAPVHAPAGVRVWYECKLRDLLRAMHDSMQVHLAAAWKCNEPTIGFAADDANPSIGLKRALSKWGRAWIRKFDGLSADLAKRFASRNFQATNNSMRQALKDAGFTVAFAPTSKSVEAYQAVIASNVALIKSIPQQYLKDVQASVWDSVMKGGDLATLSKSIQKNYGVGYRRAALIARTENFKAKAVIENVRRQELGLTEAIWMHSSAGKVPRPTHVAMNGKKYELKKGMYDSHEGEFVFPGQLINCRCTSRAVLEGFNDA